MSNNILNDISNVYLNSVAESAVPGKPAERLGAVTAIPKSDQDAARERTLAKAAAIRAKKGITQEGLDPVGKEDADLDNDGKSNTKKDKYLMNRRNVIKQELATQKEAKEVKKWWDDDGDGKGYEKGEVGGKFTKKKKEVKEGYSNWRQDLSEVISDIETNKTVKEKKVNNKIAINPKLDLGETIENLGGELIEMVEIDEKTLTSAETAKKEQIVKSMKKGLSGFKSRYGDRAKEVMYATATKQAKKVAEAVADQSALSPQELQKQRQKATLDTQIAQMRKQSLLKTKNPTAEIAKEEFVDEKTRYAKETGINFRKQKAQPKGGSAKDDKVFQAVSKMMGSGRAGVQPRGKKKDPGKKPPAAGEYGSGVKSPAQKVAQRRATRQQGQSNMSSRFD